jgi:hypothetical protein
MSGSVGNVDIPFILTKLKNNLLRTVKFYGSFFMRNFESQVAEYVSSCPAINIDGVVKYVVTDGVRVAGINCKTYQISYFLTDAPQLVDFYKLLNSKPKGLSSSEGPRLTKYCGGFAGYQSFEEAKELFEESVCILFRKI